MDGEFPWIYVAMIVIAFVSWVFNRIQEATAGRRRAEEIKQRQEDGDFDYEDEDYVFDEEDFIEESESPPVSAPPASGEDAMRKLMEALGGTVAQAPEPSPPPRTIQKPSPPAFSPPSKAGQPRMSAEERAALARLKKRTEVKPIPKKRAGTKLAQMSISDLVRDPDGIRKAILLREILDQPRSERPWE